MTNGRINLYLTLNILFAIIFFAVVAAHCQLVRYDFPDPGLRGMVSNIDPSELLPEEALYLKDADVNTTMGILQKRMAVNTWGTNSVVLWGVTGYYNPLTKHKLLLGVTDNADYSLGQFVVSDTFGVNAGTDTLGGTIFPYADVHHDWTPYKDMVVHADGKSTPAIFTTSEGFTYQLTKPDTFGYKPHLISMGMEAPGQPRIGIVGTGGAGGAGNLDGTYAYVFAFISDSVPSIQSRILTVSNKSAYITNFPMNKGIHLLRKSGQSENQWYRIYTDTITQSEFYYVDTGLTLDTAFTRAVRWYRGDTAFYDTLPASQLGGYRSQNCFLTYRCCVDGNLGFYDSLGYRRTINGTDVCETCSGSYCYSSSPTITTDVDSFFIDSSYSADPFEPLLTGRKPGQFSLSGVTGSAGAVDTTHASKPESLYYIAYSYYDPITGIESPLGPLLACSLTIAYIADSVKANAFKFDDFDTTLNTKWIRVYQTITKTILPGASDTMVWYGLFELRNLREDVVFGEWNDDDVVAGLDTSYLDINLYYPYQLLRDWQGEVKVLPPYSYDCQIPFSDIEYLAGRLWAIGDPANPNYIYYSAFDNPATNIFSWHPFDFIVVYEIGDDEFIALELAVGFGEDMLYAFTHNSIWIIDDQGNYEAISTRIGAVSRETIVKRGEAIYFMSPEMRFYVLRGTSEPVEISKPIENWIDSLFVSYSWFSGYGDYKGRGMNLGDHVMWSNDSSGMILAFNTKQEAGTWSARSYQQGNYKPRGSFPYDTLHTNEVSVSFTTDLELLYGVTPSDSSIPFRQEVERNFDVAGAATDLILLNYRTSHLGDGFRQWQVSQIRVKVQPLSSGILHYAVYDDNEDSLCAGIYTFSSAEVSSGAPVNIFLAPPYNIGDKLSVKYFTAIDSASDGEGGWLYYWSNLKIHDHSVWLQDMGAYDVQ